MSSHKTTVFDFLRDLSETKSDILDEGNESDYSPWIVNRFLSMHPTTIMYANEMNLRYFLPKKMQYDYYLHAISKTKRFFKYVKEDEQANIDLVKEYFGYNKNRAKEVLSILSKDDIDMMKKRLSKGGHNAKTKRSS